MTKPQGKAELRRQYLLEKYVWKWKQFMRSRKGEGLFPRLLKLSHNNWLRQVIKHFCMTVELCFMQKRTTMTNWTFVAGSVHTCHPGRKTGSLHYCGGSYHNPQPQATGPGPAHQVWDSNIKPAHTNSYHMYYRCTVHKRLLDFSYFSHYQNSWLK